MSTYYGWDTAPTNLLIVPILVGSVNGNGGWGWPVGTQAGDLVMIYGIGNDNISSAGWNLFTKHDIEGGSGTDLMWKVVDAADLSVAPPAPAEAFGYLCMMVWRGVDTCREASLSPVVGGAGGTTTIPGFTKEPDSKFIVVTQSDRDPGDATTWSYPSGFTGILVTNNAYFATRLSYKASTGYAGEDIVCSLVASAYGGMGIAYELYLA